MSHERGLTEQEFRRVLDSAKYQKRITQLARYTLKTGTEGGLAVYKKPDTGKLSISEADLPDEEENEEARQDFNGKVSLWEVRGQEDWKETYGTRKLLTKRWKTRNDIGLFVHSHPAASGDETDFLRPSITDLENYEMRRGHSPEAIEGILVPHIDETMMMFYRATDISQGFYNTLEYEPSQPLMLEMMSDNGYPNVVTSFDPKTGSPNRPSDEVAFELFSN